MILRQGRIEDAEAMMRVKAALRMPDGQEETIHGGFLLGTDIERYYYFLENERVLVIEDEEKGLVGFSIVVGDKSLRMSEMWGKKDQVDWQGIPEGFWEKTKVAYYEQLAVLPDPRYRTYAKNIAFRNLEAAFEDHDLMFTAVVTAPIRNLAAVPFLKIMGFSKVGSIDEHYPEYGHLVSDVYALSREQFRGLMAGPFGEIAARKVGGLGEEPG